VLPEALAPGPRGAWDDLATWTGSVIEHSRRWYMLYTGINLAEAGLIQRIGLAVSDDLITWRKHSANPVIEADPRWYELLDLTSWRDQSWRDPFLFRGHRDSAFHALITARSAAGDADGRGVVAHARSADLVHWEVLPPVTTPGDFAQVEVPQFVQLNGHRHILFSAHPEDHSRQRVNRLGPGQEGTYTFTASASGEPFHPSAAPIAPESGPLGPLYAGKLVEAAPGDWRFLAFRAGTGDAFIGELTDPLPVNQNPDGQLSITAIPNGAAFNTK
jgi:beta-fructofuranosidase